LESNPIGNSKLVGSRLAYGCWRIADARAAAGAGAGMAALIAAYEAGYTLFDGADVYGDGRAEEILGETLRAVSGMRERILIVSKCGVRRAGAPRPESPQRWDWSREHIVQSCEASLQRMGVATIDLYLLHRPDYLGDPHEVAEALQRLRAAGKLRHVGVSNCRPSLLQLLQAAMAIPLLVNQVEISLTRTAALDDGTLDQCLEQSITPMAWSPLAAGALGDGARRPGSVPAVTALLHALDAIAAAHGVSRSVIAYAWLLRHPARIVPIVGSTDPQRIRAAVQAMDFELTREEWYGLLEAARGTPVP
jgi:predicted oxidoreductase